MARTIFFVFFFIPFILRVLSSTETLQLPSIWLLLETSKEEAEEPPKSVFGLNLFCFDFFFDTKSWLFIDEESSHCEL
jgi:hypothetical protein